MKVISYEEFIAHPDDYFTSVLAGKALNVVKDGRTVTMLLGIDVFILSEAIDIAKLIINRPEE